MFKILGVLGIAAVVVWLSVDTSEPQAAPDSSLKETSEVETSLEETGTDLQKEDSQSQEKSLVTDFASSVEADRWRTVNDTVMGGISQSQFSVTPAETGLFSGSLSLENNGGFSSIRRDVSDIDLSNATEISLRVKGDGRLYQLRLKMNSSTQAPSYRAEFETQPGEWLTVTLPLSNFEPVNRGRIVEDEPSLLPEEVVEVGLMLADKQSGEFALEIDWIQAE